MRAQIQTIAVLFASVTLLGIAHATSERFVVAPAGTLGSMVRVEHRTAPDGTVSGTLTNVSRAPIEDVKIAVRHRWVWNREWDHEASPNRPPDDVAYHEIDAAIAPGRQVVFTVEPPRPLGSARPAGGHYTTVVDVVSLVERGGAPGSVSAPTSQAAPPVIR